MHRAPRHRYRRDRMLENQLLQVARLEHQGEFIEAFDLASQFHAAHQVYRHVDAVAAQSVQKTILDVLRILCCVVHFPESPLYLLIFCLFVFLFKQFDGVERVYTNRKTQSLPIRGGEWGMGSGNTGAESQNLMSNSANYNREEDWENREVAKSQSRDLPHSPLPI